MRLGGSGVYSESLLTMCLLSLGWGPGSESLKRDLGTPVTESIVGLNSVFTGYDELLLPRVAA